MGQSYPNTKVN